MSLSKASLTVTIFSLLCSYFLRPKSAYLLDDFGHTMSEREGIDLVIENIEQKRAEITDAARVLK